MWLLKSQKTRHSIMTQLQFNFQMLHIKGTIIINIEDKTRRLQKGKIKLDTLEVKKYILVFNAFSL